MSDVISGVNTALGVADSARNRTLDIVIIAAGVGLIWLWWKAHVSDVPTSLVPNEDVGDVANSVPETVYTYNMPFFRGARKMIAIPKAPSPTRLPQNPSRQPTFSPVDNGDEQPAPSICDSSGDILAGLSRKSAYSEGDF